MTRFSTRVTIEGVPYRVEGFADIRRRMFGEDADGNRGILKAYVEDVEIDTIENEVIGGYIYESDNKELFDRIYNSIDIESLDLEGGE